MSDLIFFLSLLTLRCLGISSYLIGIDFWVSGLVHGWGRLGWLVKSTADGTGLDSGDSSFSRP